MKIEVKGTTEAIVVRVNKGEEEKLTPYQTAELIDKLRKGMDDHLYSKTIESKDQQKQEVQVEFLPGWWILPPQWAKP